MSKQLVLQLGLVVYLAVLWAVLLTQKDRPVVLVLVALMASPVLLFVLRFFLEKEPSGLFDPRTQSWAFLFGDVLGLPLALAAASYGQRFVPSDSWSRSPWWLGVCVVAGVLAGVGFHKMEQAPYATAGYEQALLSPTKLAHDFVSYPLLFGALLFLLLPVIVHHFAWAGLVGLAGVVLWAAMAGKDMVDPPHPSDLHPRWDVERFSVRE